MGNASSRDRPTPAPPSKTDPPAPPPARRNILTLSLIALAVLIIALGAIDISGFFRLKADPFLVFTHSSLIIAALAIIGFLAHRLRRQVFSPLQNLRAWSERLRAGNLFTPIPEPEKGALAGITRDINSLTRELNSLINEMDSKVKLQTEHIASKTRSLEILYDIATDLSTARNLEELLEQFLDTLMVLVDAQAASVRLLTDDGHTRLVASRGLSEDIIKQEQIVDVDRCLCGRIAKHGGLGVQKGLGGCNRFLSAPMLDKECNEFVVVPLQYRDRILGVYNLFLDRPSAELGKDVRDMLNSIGKHLGLAVEKARLDDNERRLAIMEERNMIGNELHDSLAQSLVSMRLQTKLLGELLHKKQIVDAKNEVRRLRSAVEEAHDSLRQLLANFKFRMDERGLIPTLEEMVERFKEETDINVFLQNEWADPDFTVTEEVQVFRIVQEALTNVRKHSNACNVRILLYKTNGGEYNVLIEDDGLGMPAAKRAARPGENIGLTIMRERAAQLHGKLAIESDPGEGTRVLLTFSGTSRQSPRQQPEKVSRAGIAG